MKKLLSLFSMCCILGSTASSVVSCAAPDGPEVKITIIDPSDGTIYNTSKDTFQGDTKPTGSPSNYTFNGDSKNQIGINNYIAYPSLTILNLNKNDKQTEGAVFPNAFYDNSLNGSITHQKASNTGDPAKNQLWKDFYKGYDSTDDNFFTNFDIKPNITPPISTYSSLTPVPLVTELGNDKYFTDNQAGRNKFVLGNAYSTFITFNKVNQTLGYLNNPANDFVSADASTGVTDEKRIEQQTSMVIMPIGNLTTTFTYETSSKKFEFEVNVNNLFAVLNYVIYFHKVDVNDKEEKLYYSGWVLRRYDYFASVDQQSSWLNKNITKSNTHFSAYPQSGGVPNLFYAGFANTKTKPPNERWTGNNTPGEFPNQTAKKASSGISYPEFGFSIDFQSIKEVDL